MTFHSAFLRAKAQTAPMAFPRHLKATEAPPHAVHYGKVSSFTPQDSSVSKILSVQVTDAQAHGDRAWVTSAGKCPDGMRSHFSPSLRHRGASLSDPKMGFQGWKMVTPLLLWSRSTHSPTPLGEEEDRGDETPPLLTADPSVQATCIGSSLGLGQKLRYCP